MSEAKHVDGPWELCTEPTGYEICTIHGLPSQRTEDRRGQTWAQIRPVDARSWDFNWPSEDQQMATANLILAAPDLLAALYNMLEDGDKTDREQALRAIAKAEGRS